MIKYSMYDMQGEWDIWGCRIHSPCMCPQRVTPSPCASPLPVCHLPSCITTTHHVTPYPCMSPPHTSQFKTPTTYHPPPYVLSKLVQTCSNSSKIVQACPNLSKLIQTCPNSSKLVQTHPNSSKLVQTHPSSSKLVQFFSFLIFSAFFTHFADLLPCPNLSQLVPTCPNLPKPAQNCPNIPFLPLFPLFNKKV